MPTDDLGSVEPSRRELERLYGGYARAWANADGTYGASWQQPEQIGAPFIEVDERRTPQRAIADLHAVIDDWAPPSPS